MKTYTYGTSKVIVEKGIVTRSDFIHCTVGQKPNIAALKACGWKLEKSPVVYYINGTTSPSRLLK